MNHTVIGNCSAVACFIDKSTNELTPWNGALSKKLIGPQLVRKFPAFCGNRRYTRIVPKVMSNLYACELGTADEGECGGRWNQLLFYPSVSCDVNSLHHVTSITPDKMTDNDMLFRQRAVIEFLVKEDIPAAEFHQRL